MKSFYQFYKLLKEENGAPSQGTTTNDQGTGAPPQLPTAGASKGAAPMPNQPAPPAHEPSPVDNLEQEIDNAIQNFQGNPNQQMVKPFIDQLNLMKQQVGQMADALAKEKPQEGQDKQGMQNMAQQNKSAMGPPGQASANNAPQAAGMNVSPAQQQPGGM
jgi:hypothetical protein